MKIRTQLIISMVFFGLALAIISASLIATNQQVERLNKQEELARSIELKVSELNYLSNNYLLYHESQQTDRWESKYSSISADISNLTVDQPDQLVLLSNLKNSQQRLKEIFGDITSRIESTQEAGINTDGLEFVQTSGSRIGVQTQGMVFDASRLAQMLSQQAEETKQRNNLFIFALIGAFLAFLLANYILINRRTLTSLSNLQAGAEIIGSGNLDYSIVERKDDEIGELAKAFNRMTANLKTVTASKADLEREIVERRQAEDALQEAKEELEVSAEELRQQNEELVSTQSALQESEARLRRLYESGLIGVIYWNMDGVVTDANDKFLEMVGYTRQDLASGRIDWINMTPPEYRHLDESSTKELKATGVNEKPFEKEYTRKDGTRIPIIVAGAMLDAARFNGVAIVLDITERKQAEKEIEHLASFPQLNPNPVLELDSSGRVSFANSATSKVLGELCLDCASAFLPDDLDAILNSLRKGEDETFYREVKIKGRTYGQVIYLSKKLDVVRIYASEITERKQAEEALHQAYGRLQTFFDQRIGGIGIVIANARGDILQANDYYLSILGCTREELLSGQVDWRKMTPPEWLPADERALAQLQERGVCDTYEKEYVRRDGTRVPVLITDAMMPGDSGDILAFVFDITERKQAEEALRESEDRYRGVVENTTAIILRIDTAGIITFANRRALDFFSYSAEELIGKHAVGTVVPPQEGSGRDLTKMMDQIAANPDAFSANANENICKDGRRVWLEWTNSGIYGADGKLKGLLSVGIDATARKQAEEERQRLANELADSVAELQAVLDAAPVAVWIAHDPQCQRITGNAYADQILQAPQGGNVSRSALPGEAAVSYRVLCEGAELKPEEMPAQVATATGRPVMGDELELIFPDGRTVHLIESAVPLFDAEGQVRGAVIAGADVTQIKLAEEALQKANDELEMRVQERTADLTKANAELIKARDAAEAAVEAKAAFLANMSHELRTPMNAVIGFSSLLLDDSLTPDQKDYVERIRIGGEALLALINDILDFSKMEKGKVKIEHQPLSLRHCIEEALSMVAVKADERGLNLSCTISYGTPDAIIGDQGRLRQVLLNLLSNAVKFTDSGAVSVSVSSKALENNKQQILFAVRDTGIGIPEDKMEMLFLPFSQLEYNLSQKRDGTGLGLAISKSLVELMGGEIWAFSTPGLGSEFHFTIEAEIASGKAVNSVSTAKAAFENLAEKKPMRILVAEDVPSNQKVLVEMLKRMGYMADMAADGREVLQALELLPYDVVLMDIQMPEMDGLEAARQIRKRWPTWPKIIAITAYALEGDREKCLEAGMDDYIAKPVKKDDLVEALSHIYPPQE